MRQLMLKLSIILLCFGMISAQTFAKNIWSLEKKKSVQGKAFITNGKFKYEVEESNVVLKITKIKKYKDLEIIVYHASSSGTSLMLNEYYAVIFNTKNNKFLGDYPYEYEVVSENIKNLKPTKPVWTYKGNQITIIEADLGIKKILRF